MLLSILRRLSNVLICLLFVSSAQAGVLDLRLKVDQIFDVQWNISGGNLNASGFNYIYSSVNYATQTTSAARWTAAQTADAGSNGRYIAFFNSTTNPGTYGMAVFNSDGSVYKLINNTGTFRALASGAIFYNGNGMWGTLITTEAGYSLGSSGSWAVTVNYPTSADLEAYVAPAYSSNQTASPPPPPPPAPTPIYRNSAISPQQTTKKNNSLSETTGHNAKVNIEGDANDVYILQAGAGGHYASVGIQGDTNNVDVNQTSSVGARHYLEANIIGSSNVVNLTQSDAAKTQFVTVNGNSNNITTSQTGTGSHFLDLSVTGDNHTASLTQRGSGNHEARVTLDGSQPWNFSLTQDGATSQQYTLPHDMSDGSVVNGTCSTIGGCNLTVNQQ